MCQLNKRLSHLICTDLFNRTLLSAELLQETLFTLHMILFPSTDPASQIIMRREKFDESCRLSLDTIGRIECRPLVLKYWGERLSVLSNIEEPEQMHVELGRCCKGKHLIELLKVIIAAATMFIGVPYFWRKWSTK